MKTAKLLQMALLVTCLSLGSTGCLHPRTKVLDPNTTVVKIPKAVPFTPVSDGYFVPDSTMLRLLDQLSNKDVFGTPGK